MRKKVLSLCMTLVLCLSLLPATALAATPGGQIIYVGNEDVTNGGYWTTDSDGSVTPYTEGGKPTDNYIHYDAGNNTLTLHNATIKTSNDHVNVSGSAIGVLNGSGDAALTIQLEGDNTIENVNMGIYVYSYSAGTATLNITGDGSLNASGSGDPGIMVLSTSGDATLTIKNAEVTATSEYGSGVRVQADDSSDASLSVDGGSLTATGNSNYGAGIQYTFGSSSSGSGTPSLTVSGNAIVKASGGEGGISDNSSTDIQIGDDNNSSGGIVFNNGTGTVYGNVTLEENLTIGEGESLTILDGASLTIDSGATLTNEGTVTNSGTLTNNGTINNSGTLPDNIGGNGTVNHAPTITTDSLPNGEVGTYYEQELMADGTEPIAWSVSGSLPAGLSLNASTGKITGTPSADGTFNFTLTATNDYGSDSKEFTLTIDQQGTIHVTSVSLDKDTMNLTEGSTATLTATVEPDNASNRSVTWSSDNESVATVNATGEVTAIGAGTATITVTTADGGKTATCEVTVTAATVPVTSVELNKTETTLTVGERETLTATVEPNNATDQNVTWSTSNPSVATVENGVVRAVGRGTAVITVTTADGDFTADCTVTVRSGVTVALPASGPNTGSSEGWSGIGDEIAAAQPGDEIVVDMGGTTEVPAEIFEEVAGKDVDVTFELDNGVSWTVNGTDIPEGADISDLDLGVTLGTSGISVDVINSITGEVGTVQITLSHDGEFSFALTLTAPLGSENAGYWANLYHYDEDNERLVFETSSHIAADGTAALRMTHASQYAIVIDDASHEMHFADVSSDAWFYDAVAYVYANGLMDGVSDTQFDPDGSMTRAMVWAILARIDGKTVTGDNWVETARTWAMANGVSDGENANSPVTREQLATMLWRYAGESDGIAPLSSWRDAASVSDWAATAMRWSIDNGIITGVTGDTLVPQGTAARAQCAAMLMRYMAL